ncbi:hypothetical protein Gogos_017298 [Gossypium gossypioides]|uniref:Uncharacterized protein n=1 Tax=Gossypium gossypioides TaxID=34282 RepID=A0A7J9BAF2_GOSGO|nr:hypothetical protein [Gossypium gossypioides]
MVTVSSISTLGQLEILNKSNLPFGLVQLFIANAIPFFVSSSNTFMSSPTEFCIATFPFPLVFVHTEFTLLLFIRRLLGMKVLTVANGRVWFPSWLNLAGNDFGNSEIPSEFGKLRSLISISLSDTGLTGLVPPEFSLLSELVSLDLGLNYLLCRNHDFNMLVHNLTKSEKMVLGETNWSSPLSLLDISWTRFSKGLSSSIANLKHLKTLNLLYRCDFMGGVLPSSAFNLTSLTFLDFSGNFPQGTLPNNISGLSYLDLYANLLNGRVPGWLFSLPSLEYLDLSSNKFSGPIDTIPSSFFDFMNLTFLDLSSNNLSGNIKSCMLVKLRNLRSLDLSFNNLPSLTRCSNDVNSTLPMIIEFHFSSCKLQHAPFPKLLECIQALAIFRSF